MSVQVLNGVDVDKLVSTVGAIASDKDVGQFEFRSMTEWKQGAVIETTFTGHKQSGVDSTREKAHTWGGDEPPGLLGTGLYQGPTDSLLHAMSHCITVTTAYHGAARGIKIDKMKVKATGSLDLQGFLGLNPTKRPGFREIHLQMMIDSPASSQEVYDLFRFAQGHSPICTTVRSLVPIEFDFDVDVVDEKDAYTEDDETRHGISHKGVCDTVQGVKENPDLGTARFFTETEWKGGAQVETTFSKFEHPKGNIQARDEPLALAGDEPTVLLGKDIGPGPTETVLHGVGNCISVGASYFAAAQNIKLHEFSLEFDGDVNLQGFADVNDFVTPGYSAIRAKLRARASGCTKEELLAFMQTLPDRSPICDSVGKPVHTTFGLTHNGKEISGLDGN